jgi:hypothetical protein
VTESQASVNDRGAWVLFFAFRDPMIPRTSNREAGVMFV